MPFQRELPEWKNEGQRPPESMVEKGWRPLDHPPADVFNWHWYLVYHALSEIHAIGATHDDVTAALDEAKRLLKAIVDRRDNPHQVTKTQVGLSNVDNYKQATKVEFDAHTNSKNNPHDVTTAQVNVTNVKASNVSASAYPVGMSIFEITNAVGWPSSYGTIVTYKIDSSRTFQWFYDRGDSIQNQGVYFRTHHTTPGWAEWSQVETVASANAKLKSHSDLRSNPHGVTKSQVGLGNVDNLKQATKVEFDAHVADQKNPHNVTSLQVNVINPLNADEQGLTYPTGISMFQTANGVSLGFPTNQIIVHTITQGAHRCFQYIYDASTGSDRIWFRTWRQDGGWKNLSESETTEGAQSKVNVHENKKTNPHNVTKDQVGLGNVDNTKQATKVEFVAHTEDGIKHITSTERSRWNAAEKNAKSASVSKSGDTVNGTLTVTRGLVLGTTYSTIDGLLYYRDTSDDIRAKMARGWVSIETEDGSAAKVKAHADQKTNPHGVTKAQVGLGNVDNVKQVPISRNVRSGTGLTGGGSLESDLTFSIDRAFFSDAESGDNNEKVMTPATTKRAIQTWAKSEHVNRIGVIAASAGLDVYPLGISTFRVISEDNANYPYSADLIMTIKADTFRATQFSYGNVTSIIRFRKWNSSNNSWTSWKEQETTDGAQTKVNAHENKKNNPHNVTSEQVNNIDFKPASDLASTYPTGVSLFSISRQNNDVTGFPFGFGTIQTNRVHNSRTFQIFTGNGDTEESKNSWIRWAFENRWTPWQEYMSADTGWIKLPLQNGVKLHGSQTGIYIRLVGKMVQLRGAVTNIFADSTQITTLPSQFTPSSGRSLVGNTSLGNGTSYFVRYHLSGHNGAFTMTRSSRPGYEEGIWYPLDFTWMIDD